MTRSVQVGTNFNPVYLRVRWDGWRDGSRVGCGKTNHNTLAMVSRKIHNKSCWVDETSDILPMRVIKVHVFQLIHIIIWINTMCKAMYYRSVVTIYDFFSLVLITMYYLYKSSIWISSWTATHEKLFSFMFNTNNNSHLCSIPTTLRKWHCKHFLMNYLCAKQYNDLQ